MAKDLLQALEDAEEKWRKSSPEWNQKLRDWETWKLRAKERERLRNEHKSRNKRRIQTSPALGIFMTALGSSPSIQTTHRLNFLSQVPTYSYSKSELEEDIAKLAWVSIEPWALACLRRGIAVHHAGMNKRYRSLVER
jgi:hypothetical protein